MMPAEAKAEKMKRNPLRIQGDLEPFRRAFNSAIHLPRLLSLTSPT